MHVFLLIELISAARSCVMNRISAEQTVVHLRLSEQTNAYNTHTHTHVLAVTGELTH